MLSKFSLSLTAIFFFLSFFLSFLCNVKTPPQEKDSAQSFSRDHSQKKFST